MSTLNYKEKTYDDLFTQSITNAQNVNLISEDEDFISHIKNNQDIENIYVLDLSVQSLNFQEAYKEITRNHKNNNINLADEEGLNVIGEKFNIIRPAPKRSIAGLVFSLQKVNDTDVIIPEGTIVETDDGEQYVTVKTGIIVAGQLNINVLAKSSLRGYNTRVPANTLKNIITKIPVINNNISVINPNPSMGGNDGITDDEYRAILKEWPRIFTKGTKESFENFLQNYEGINDYRIIPKWDGPGTLKIIIDIPEEASETITTEIYEQLTEKVCQYKDDPVIVEVVKKVKVGNVNCTINVDIDNITPYSLPEKETIALRVKNALITFINGGYKSNGQYYKGLGISEDFIPFRASLFIGAEVPEVKNIIFENNSNFVVGDYEKAIAGDIIVNFE